MATASSIEWTEMTWNPVRGCTRVSPGCVNCYAERQAVRFAAPGAPFDGFVKKTASGPRWTGKVEPIEHMLDWPLRTRKPHRVFVNSMSDLFHEGLSDRDISRVFDVMVAAPQHTFQVLTKRADRMRDFAGRCLARGAPAPNIWLGVSVEDQVRAIERIPHLLATPAAIRFLSCEPLLGRLDNLPLTDGIHWVIVGGESGPGARPMKADWVTSLHHQCRAARVPFFFKQWGGVRKGRFGRQLYGRTFDEMPIASPPTEACHDRSAAA